MSCDLHRPGCVSNNVLIGQNAQLFLFEGSYNQFSFLSGQERVTTNSKNNFIKNLRTRRAFADRLKIPFLHMVVPCKPLVMRHHCPEPYRRTIRSLFLHSYLPLFRESNPIHEKCIYPLGALIASQAYQDCYWSNDTHINAIGQLTLYREIGKYINNLTYSFEASRIIQKSKEGDLGVMLGKYQHMPGLRFTKSNITLEYSNTKELPGNSGEVIISFNPLSQSERRLVLFGDSFIKTMLHLFAHDFRTIIHIRGPYFQPDIIKMFRPDALITSETERYLAGVVPDSDGRSLLLNTVISQINYKPNAEFIDAFKAQMSADSHYHITEEWESQQRRAHTLCVDNFGEGLHNQQIRQITEQLHAFEAVGTCPIFHFYRLYGNPCGILVIEMQSEIQSRLKLTVLRNCSRMMAPREVHEKVVDKGHQIYQFPVDHSQPVEGLLFQPLHQPGSFRLLQISWQVEKLMPSIK